MSCERGLPFPRGKTYGDGVVTLTDTTAKHLEGKVYEVEDTVYGTGQTIKLRVVKNDSGADITVARKFMKFSGTDANDFGRRCAGFASTAGSVCKPLDEAYTVGATIPDDDLFYVLEEGWGKVNTAAGSISLGAGAEVATTADGLIGGVEAVAGEYVAGRVDVACTTASTATRIWVDAGFNGGIVGT